MQKKDFVEVGYPAIHYGQIHTKYGLSAKKTFTYISKELFQKLRKAQNNDLLLATTSENDEDVVKPLAWLGNKVAISGDMILFRHEQNVKYLAYFLQTEAFQAQKRKYITGAKVRRVSGNDLAKISVPIPAPTTPKSRWRSRAKSSVSSTHSSSLPPNLPPARSNTAIIVTNCLLLKAVK